VGLAAAQQDMFDNRYTAADGDYARLLAAAPNVADVHAGFALFLNYRNDFGDALRQARRGVVLDRRSGAAAAVLCRVQDWSGDITHAVVSGRSAVRLAAENPLAHLFYAEALADSGDYAGSKDQIGSANALIARHPTRFLSAEAQREVANLDGDLGQRSAQIAALQAALRIQPHWLYRTAEVVDAELGANQKAAAHQALDSAVAETPDDIETLQMLGNDAVFVGDASAAVSLWARALRLAPGDATLLDMNGLLAVAAKNDVDAAVREFERALTVDPQDLHAAAFLVALGRYVQKEPEAGYREIKSALSADVGARSLRRPPPPQPDAAGTVAAAQALARVNHARAAAGLAAVHLDAHLTASADSHAFYWLFNNLAPSVSDLGIHLETPGLPGYSGQFPWARAAAYGYADPRIGEDITHRGGAVAAVDDWVNSVFHRFALLRPDLTAVGYSQAQVGSLLIEDMEFGFAVAAPAVPVAYPAGGARDVPAIFVDNELPDPVPAGKPRTTGYPVTMTFSQAATVSVASFALTGPDGKPVVAYVLSPSPSSENSAALLPASPLQANAAYTARIAATVDGRSFTRTWTFTTAS